nr:MAG TPA: hypothetical protein [Caudoviricetes sp.]
MTSSMCQFAGAMMLSLILKRNSRGINPGIFYTFLMYFAETNPKYFPAMRI